MCQLCGEVVFNCLKYCLAGKTFCCLECARAWVRNLPDDDKLKPIKSI